ncbi:MAG: 16S rRNA (uracil(1498)-N(3))-methyltransferase [Candidatus Ancillula sp.]|jgi:16S rRNA (uracil1498-N3)-methyltransferase|nr:16S rRNA (uracil(1498)-N(3))-methyltransferase [Candidatus Ancillula sp.]
MSTTCETYFLRNSENINNLEKDEINHIVTVRRHKAGDFINLVNGKGLEIHCQIKSVSPFSLIEVSRIQENQHSPEIVLVQALIKGKRFEQAIENAVELGVDKIIPWQANRSIAKWSSNSSKKFGNLVITASKQSRRSFFPSILDAQTTKQLLVLLENDESKMIILLDENGLETLSISKNKILERARKFDQKIYVIIGPEGSISPEEINQFDEIGAKHYLLGSTILRSATAATAALSLLLL